MNLSDSTYCELFQSCGSCIANKYPRARFKCQGSSRPLKLKPLIFFTVHEQSNIISLNSHCEFIPPVSHHRHFKGSSLSGDMGPRLRVVHDYSLGAVINWWNPQSQVDCLLEGICYCKEHSPTVAVWFHGHHNGEVPVERRWYYGTGQPANVGVCTKAVSWEPSIARDKVHRRRKWDSYQLREVKVSFWASLCAWEKLCYLLLGTQPIWFTWFKKGLRNWNAVL